MRIEEVLQLGDAPHGSPVGLRHTEFGEPGSHDELVLRELQGIGARMHHDPVGDERSQDVLRNMLVVERHDVDVRRESAHGFEVAVVTDRGGRERGRHPLALGEHSQVETELHRRCDHHPGQLSSADHANTQRHVPSPFVCTHSRAPGGPDSTRSGSAFSARPCRERRSHIGVVHRRRPARRDAPGSARPRSGRRASRARG